MKPSEYLDKVRGELNLPSDYALQGPLGLSKQQLSRYRKNADVFSDEVAMRVASLCGLEAWRVLVDMHIERAKSPEARSAWTGMMGMMEKFSESFRNLLLGYGPHVASVSCANR
ncbi:hypothetical protein GTP23_12045 [Pseudoduganella sp. FT93W]|uniref:XRE family transcriptional regulator n=1 Tax=Duganella fentianensis TaxID=2692177 RepID=A0A845I4B6_9BURK|nr:hypothetical protein [Duganella fentianensis]MYN45778.1 hypothetical protein [Duganella fentianensis]